MDEYTFSLLTMVSPMPYEDCPRFDSTISMILKSQSNDFYSNIYYRFDAGCYFTKCTRDKCDELGIRGWVKNSKNGTIVGKMQGIKANVDIL